MKRLYHILMLLLCLVFVLSSCNTIPEESKPFEEESSTEDTLPSSTTTSTDTEEETDPPATELVLYKDGKTDFTIVRSETEQGVFSESATNLYKKFMSDLNIRFGISTDWINPTKPSPEKNHEILVGITNRSDSIKAMEDLDFDGYIIRVTEYKVVIVGSQAKFLISALYRFYDDVVNNTEYLNNGTLTLPVGLEIKEECEDFVINFEEAFASGKKVSVHATKLFSYSGPSSQGAATDGKYVYTAIKREVSTSVEVAKIVKIDISTWEVVKEGEELPLDHANDMTYDPEKNLLIVTNMQECKITLIDCDTLDVVETKILTFGTYGAGYIGDGKIAFLGYGYPSGLVIASSADYTPISSSPLNPTTGYIGQGMGSDGNYIYVPLSPKSGNTDNIIQIYNAEGKYLGTASLALNWESETIFYDGSNYYVQFNRNGSTISKLEFYIPFQ